MNFFSLPIMSAIWITALAGFAAEPASTTTSSPQQPNTVEPQFQLTVPATRRSEAMVRARIGAGRIDPFAPPSSPALRIFPFTGVTEIKSHPTLPKIHLPPPPKFSDSGLVPPPPPGVVSLPGAAHAAVSELRETDLPEPPEKPQIVNKMKLVGVIGEKALFSITDAELRHANKWPLTVTLATGEQFESVHLVSIDNGTVILEEDGQRTTKELERIR